METERSSQGIQVFYDAQIAANESRVAADHSLMKLARKRSGSNFTNAYTMKSANKKYKTKSKKSWAQSIRKVPSPEFITAVT
jgi:hypothetical protein